MSDVQEIQLTDVAPRYDGEKIHNASAARRGKENVAIEDRRGNFSPLFSKSAREDKEEGVVRNMEHEFAILKQLEETGITPIPLLFKTNEERSESHLLTTRVEGKSLESLAKSGRFEHLSAAKLNMLVRSILASLNQIHERGVLIRDVNSGSFVINESDQDGEPKVSVVDFEFALNRDDFDKPSTRHVVSETYAFFDFGYAASGERREQLSFDEAVQTERYMAIHTVVNAVLGDDMHIDIDALTDEDQMMYHLQYEAFEDAFIRLGRRHRNIYGNIGDLVDRAMLNITLPYLLRKKGVELDAEIQTYICSALSPILSERPDTAFESEEEIALAA